MRKAIVIIVIAIGACALIYGFASHTLTVHFTQKVAVEVPALPENTFGGETEGPPGDGRTETIEVEEERTITEPEPSVVYEVTFGGVQRLDDGRIVRTYDPAQGPPPPCPT
jgi:hypothetical protein